MFRKDEAVIGTWTPERPDFFAELQREITSDAVKTLRPGGLMMYSRSYLRPQEDEGTVSFLLENFPEMELIEMEGYEGFQKAIQSGETAIRRSKRPCASGRINERRGPLPCPCSAKRRKPFPYETEEKPIEKKNKNRKPEKDRGTGSTGSVESRKQILSDFLSRMTAPIPVEELEVRAGKVYHSPSLPDGVRNLHFLRNGLYLGELKKKTVSSRHSRFAVTLSRGQVQRLL